MDFYYVANIQIYLEMKKDYATYLLFHKVVIAFFLGLRPKST